MSTIIFSADPDRRFQARRWRFKGLQVTHLKTGTCVDLIFGPDSQLRAQAEAYGGEDGKVKLVQNLSILYKVL